MVLVLFVLCVVLWMLATGLFMRFVLFLVLLLCLVHLSGKMITFSLNSVLRGVTLTIAQTTSFGF